MKLKIKTTIIFLFAILITSCNKKNSTSINLDHDTTTVSDPDSERKLQHVIQKSATNTYAVDSTISNTYLLNIIALQNELKISLKNTDSIKANRLYEDYSKKLIENLTDYNLSNSDILNNYANYQPNEIPKEWSEKISKLKNYHIEIIYEGEGFYSFQFKHDYFYNTFQNYVTKDLKKFLYNFSEDDKIVFQMDAGIVVPWREIRSRILRWEKYIVMYPESRYTTMAKEVYAFYLNSYLVGMENTRTYEITTKEIYPEVKQDFEILIKENPNMFSSEITKEFLESFNYASKNYSNEEFETTIQTHVKNILSESLNTN